MSYRQLPCWVLLAVLVVGCGKKDAGSSGAGGGPSGSPDSTGSGGGSEADNKAEAVKRLQQVAKGMHGIHDATLNFAANTVAKGGGPGLSWRVHLLPYLGKEEEALYKQFKPDEAWDSPANKKLLDKMPKVFESPG